MSGLFTPQPDTEKIKTTRFTFSLAQNIGTYTIATVAGGDVLIHDVTFICTVTGTGATATVAVKSNNGTLDIFLAATLLTALTAGLNTAPFATKTVLPSTKLIQGLIAIANGTGGTLQMIVRWTPIDAGATLS